MVTMCKKQNVRILPGKPTIILEFILHLLQTLTKAKKTSLYYDIVIINICLIIHYVSRNSGLFVEGIKVEGNM